ncbi:thioredoxin [Ruegeria phage RpAliso]|nr:thioredoxin [Ruegeria phage RpAliso]
MKKLDDKNFHRAAKAEKLVVMFSAPWAGPCNLVRPTFEEAASRLGNQIDFAEFCVDDNPSVPEQFGVRSLPCFISFEEGKPTAMKAGAIPEDYMMEWLRGMVE